MPHSALPAGAKNTDLNPSVPPESAPPEPSLDESARLQNANERARQSYWTDAAAKLERRIANLEAAQLPPVSRGFFTLPVMLAIGIALAAFAFAAYAIRVVFRR